jgi:hypothetical protein
MNHDAHDLLRRLAAADDRSIRMVLHPTPEFGLTQAHIDQAHPTATIPALDRHTRVLVRLAALLAVDAPIESLRWAVELASATGAGDDALAAVLVSTAAETGSARLARSASRLALALGFDLGLPAADVA